MLQIEIFDKIFKFLKVFIITTSTYYVTKKIINKKKSLNINKNVILI